MAWGGIVGKSFSVNEFEQYVGSVKFDVWHPRFVVVHNTSVPNRATWDGWQTRSPPITDEKWALNLESFYKGQGWSGCPHVFVTPAGILMMNHLNRRGTHTPSWNSVSWGVETVGEFEREGFEGPIKDNLIAALAILHGAAGLQLLPYERGVRGLHLHKEDPNTTHTSCPGRNLVKVDLIRDVQAEILERNDGEHPGDEGGSIGVVETSPGDPLNLRERPSASAPILTTLENGTRVTVIAGRDVGSARWLQVRVTGRLGWVAARFVSLHHE
jgi:hypothetical protein